MVRKFEDIPSDEILRRVRQMDMYSSTFMRGAASHDPIFTPLFTAIGLGGTAFSIGVSQVTFASIASAIVTSAVTEGVQFR